MNKIKGLGARGVSPAYGHAISLVFFLIFTHAPPVYRQAIQESTQEKSLALRLKINRIFK